MALNGRQSLFVREYCIDFNGTRAAIAAGYSADTAYAIASENLKKPEIVAFVKKIKAERTSKVDLRIDDVVRAITSVIRADPRELSETLVGSCRHCWGAYFLYESKPQEFRDRYAAHLASESPEEFNSMGGDGYRRSRAPNPLCPECDGEGLQYTLIKDTRALSGDAAQLYMGSEQTANGIKVSMRSKDKAIEQAAKYLGMNKETMLMGVAPIAPTLADFYGDTPPKK